MNSPYSNAHRTPAQSLEELVKIAGLPASAAQHAEITGDDPLFKTRYRIVAPGAAVIAATGLAAAELWRIKTGRQQHVRVDGRMAGAAMRAARWLKINGTHPPEDPEKVSGFYQLKDGRWMYLHCNFWNLRDVNLRVVGAPPVKAEVEKAVAKWDGIELENAIVEAGGCACLVRSEEEWIALPQMHAVAKMPLLEIIKIGDAPPRPLPQGDRPLANVRVLDLTRVLAGPTCARTLAEHGADVLRVTREDLADMGTTDFDTGVGKLCTHIDLRNPAEDAKLRELIKTCDVFSQSYRPGTLAGRGYSPEALAEMRPGIVYVTLSAWGHEGPWSKRRGYDTIVQSANGMAWKPHNDRPAFLPVSEQDYVSGYLLAYGAMVVLARRATEGGSWFVRCSLAGAGHWIRNHGLVEPAQFNAAKTLTEAEVNGWMVEHQSPIGRVANLAPVPQMSETPARWARPAVPRGHNKPEWPAFS